jgi:hypothetical protein
MEIQGKYWINRIKLYIEGVYLQIWESKTKKKLKYKENTGEEVKLCENNTSIFLYFHWE